MNFRVNFGKGTFIRPFLRRAATSETTTDKVESSPSLEFLTLNLLTAYYMVQLTIAVDETQPTMNDNDDKRLPTTRPDNSTPECSTSRIGSASSTPSVRTGTHYNIK